MHMCNNCTLYCFFNDTATTEIYTLALHDALPISGAETGVMLAISLHAVRDDLRDVLVPINKKYPLADLMEACRAYPGLSDRKSTRLNSSHANISYAVFCLK